MNPDDVAKSLNSIAETLTTYLADSTMVRLSGVLYPVVEGLRYIAENAGDSRSGTDGSDPFQITLHSLRSYHDLLLAAARQAGEMERALTEAASELERLIGELSSR